MTAGLGLSASITITSSVLFPGQFISCSRLVVLSRVFGFECLGFALCFDSQRPSTTASAWHVDCVGFPGCLHQVGRLRVCVVRALIGVLAHRCCVLLHAADRRPDTYFLVRCGGCLLSNPCLFLCVLCVFLCSSGHTNEELESFTWYTYLEFLAKAVEGGSFRVISCQAMSCISAMRCRKVPGQKIEGSEDSSVYIHDCTTALRHGHCWTLNLPSKMLLISQTSAYNMSPTRGFSRSPLMHHTRRSSPTEERKG